ncbi:MAG: ABC transporter ATP-binding protein, partial [Acidimicrobiaceae bacterium]|nr:ABC transporter ATP-binding protein [Acidimicrobiaceae bacterium]
MTTSQQAGTALAAAPGARESTVSGDALVVEGLTCELPSPAGMVRPVDNVSFTLGHSKTLGIVGESGAGKSMLVRAMLGISPASATVSGKVILDGVDIRALPKKEHRHKLGAGISLIFQDPMTSLNPVVPIGRQITEGMRFHHGVDRGEAKDRAIELLRQVGISEPEKRFRQYPHQLSGGMRQRVTIAAALGCDPQVLIADEATTALDVTVQKQILDLLGQIQAERKMSVIIITHDLGIVAGRTNDLVVMYAGQVVEKGPTRRLFKMNRNRYTAALLEAMPDLENETHAKMNTIPGQPPRLTGLGARGCRFAPRCSAAEDDCRASDPELLADPTSEVHLFRCFHPVESAATANGGTP